MNKSMTFMPPDGYAVPEGTSVGDTFQELCSFKLEKGGVSLVKMGDVDVKEDKEEGKPDYSSYVSSMHQQSQPADMPN